jgi:hypothetical protein
MATGRTTNSSPSEPRGAARKFRAELVNACNQAQFNDPDST